MAADGISPALATRSSVSVELWHRVSTGSETNYAENAQFARDESKFCRAIEFSPSGQHLAWANGSNVQIASVNDWRVVCSLPRPKAFAIKFSPKGTYLATLEHFVSPKEGLEATPNFYVYCTENGEQCYAIVRKQYSDDWAPAWSSDENLFALMIGGEALFFEPNSENGFQKPAHKIGGSRGGELSVAGAGSNPHVALYVPGVKGSPSTCKVYRYPALEQNQVVASKSFYQADRVEMMWNKRASGMILMTSTDVDTTGASYYGKQALHYLNTKGESCLVPLSKDGPIHAVEWSPKGNEFCVIYGYMPSKATFFNLKCDSVFEVAEAPRNSIYYNEYGSIVLLAGFGNLRGNVEVWNNTEKKLITTLQAPDSTMLEWAPGGEIFVTATTAPRLRMGNGFKVWHYSGALLHETLWPTGQELYEVVWQKYPAGVFQEMPISNVKVQGIVTATPQVSKAVYVPPGARGGGAGIPFSPRSAAAEKSPIPGLPIGYKVSQGQQKKSRSARRKENANGNTPTAAKPAPNGVSAPAEGLAKTENPKRNTPRPANQNVANNNEAADTESGAEKPAPRKDRHRNRKVARDPNATDVAGTPPTAGAVAPVKTAAETEKEKRIRTIQKKLKNISKLKARKENGDTLEANQLSQIPHEDELIKELNSLKVAS